MGASMIPEQDLGPDWLRDYGHIEADIGAMEEFAAALKSAVERDYAPRALAVSETMLTVLPEADERFLELHFFRGALEQAQDVALQNVYNYANGTYGFATAAGEVSERYRGSDAFARATVADVRAGFRSAGVLPGTEEQP
jgi:hypothetical protein